MDKSKVDLMRESLGEIVRLQDTEGHVVTGRCVMFSTAEDNDLDDTGNAEASIALFWRENGNFNADDFDESQILSIEILPEKNQ